MIDFITTFNEKLYNEYAKNLLKHLLKNLIRVFV